jgi:hypothetical protein
MENPLHFRNLQLQPFIKPQSMNTIFRILLPVIVIVALTGCGQKTTAVRGIVTFDGKPAKDIYVIFQPITSEKIAPEASVGVTDVNGQFALRLIDSKKSGCFPGEYAVFFRWIDPLEKPDESKPQKKGPYNIPSDAQNGLIRYTVLSNGQQEIRFDF